MCLCFVGSNPTVTKARLAQLVERKTFNLVVVGSSPTAGNRYDGRVVKAGILVVLGWRELVEVSFRDLFELGLIILEEHITRSICFYCLIEEG